MLHAALALLALVVATVLAVYKPRGMTRYGQGRQRKQRPGRAVSAGRTVDLEPDVR